MRYFVRGSFLALALLGLVWGCKKSSGGSGNGTIIGSWELRQTSGNMPVAHIPAGNGNIVSFTDTHYTIYKNGQVMKSGEYAIVKDTSVVESTCSGVPKGQFGNRIDYSDTTSTKIFFQLTGNTLAFTSGCYAYDAGHSEVFAKVSTDAGAGK